MLILCNGMMRAGSTLQYNLVRHLVGHMKLGCAHGFVAENGFRAYEPYFETWAEDSCSHVVKVHSMYPRSLQLVAAGRARICYIYRDIRDVALSAKRKFGFEGNNLSAALDHAVSVYYALKKIPGVVWQRYEDVIEDLRTAARTLGACLGIDAPDSVIESVAKECSLNSALSTIGHMAVGTKLRYFIAKSISLNVERCADRMPLALKEMARKTGIKNLYTRIVSPVSCYDQQTLLHPDHISESRGDVGVWRKKLEAQEARALTVRYQAWLCDAGYWRAQDDVETRGRR